MKKSDLPKAASKKIVKPGQVLTAGSAIPTAARLIRILKEHSSEQERKKIERYFKSGAGEYGEGDIFIGVRMGQVFQLAKEHIKMPITEIEKLLESPVHEMKTAALSIMNQQARKNKIPESYRKELFDLYIKRHDRINNWDLVDVSCIHVVGRYLFDKPRGILYKLAKSKNMWERRTAIVSTAYFIKQGQTDDTFKIAEILIYDEQDLVNKATGGWVRQAGSTPKNRPKLLSFLNKYAATMPRTTLRYAIEHLDTSQKKYYMDLKLSSPDKK